MACGKIDSASVEAFIERQIADWDTANHNYEALAGVKAKAFGVGLSTLKVQFNPARIVSSAAKVDDKSLKQRKCFLCSENRPEVQEGLDWGGYTVLVNPFPIFPRHLTIPSKVHEPQRIFSRIPDMMELAEVLDGFTLFYNGPKCGASAPDHMHFQAGNRGFMPIETDFSKAGREQVAAEGDANLWLLTGLAASCLLIEAESVECGAALFDRLYAVLDIPEGEPEPMLNVLCYYEAGIWRIFVFPRKKHRPACYFAEGDDNILISPASVDMGGVFITPLEKDFDKVSGLDLKSILDEVCLGEEEVRTIVGKLK